ncbi:MAG: phosphoribosylformylglycinamidine synthase subunit PurS [Armatimonadetes bacterium]|nr:phosphoribosylformylglycinamidine synthase subunit PurS [Armatimonadota bacterium]
MVKVRVFVTLKPSLLDSAGRTVAGSLKKLGYSEVQDARIGKIVELVVDEPREERIKEMCERLLTNPVIEDFRFEVVA